MTDKEQHADPDPEPWPAGMISSRALRGYVERGEITTVRLAVPDMQGRPKGKILSAPVFVDRMDSQAEMCAYVLATDINMTPLDGFALTGWEQGYGDLGVKADPVGIRLLPHQPGTAFVMGDAFRHNGTPVEVAPRYMLRTQLERLADFGYHVALGTEAEFVLHQGTPEDAHRAGYHGLRPAWPHNLDYALGHPPQATDFFHHLHDVLHEADIPVEAIKTTSARPRQRSPGTAPKSPTSSGSTGSGGPDVGPRQASRARRPRHPLSPAWAPVPLLEPPTRQSAPSHLQSSEDTLNGAIDKYGEPVVTAITGNLEHDGGADELGKPPARWRDWHELIGDHHPDILLRQEMTYSRAEGHHRLHAAERLLGMRGFLGAQGSGRNGTGLFVRPEVFDVRQQFEHPRLWRTPPTDIIGSLREVPDVRIVMASWHLAFNSPCGREREADEILALADKINRGAAFIGGGDCNEYPHPAGEVVPPIDWTGDAITDRFHMMHRTNQGSDGGRVGCTYVDEALLGVGLHDPARYAAHDLLAQKDALRPTAGHAKPDQGGDRRIDRVYVDSWLINAVISVYVIDTSGLSDHHAVAVVFSRAAMSEALRRRMPARAPHDLAA
ncbi:endonuclease/exonuclease/phosphatase family protein [Streptomyces sp. NPDC091217]|uniref:endonuclease/exonuclease/phosphatase family protein n=1 Tax=Streptomyces sp. NPDC091217 TaxID=3365975 RepID=UPI0038078B37